MANFNPKLLTKGLGTQRPLSASLGTRDWGLGTGDWGLGTGD
ncbi:MAG: hypothetical protein ACFKPT_00860 [Gloeotrichia echinulata GP01]